MFARLHRPRLRARLSEVIDGALPPAQEAALRRQIAADPVLTRELTRLEALVATLHAWPAQPVPADFRRDLNRALAVERQPLRDRFSDLLDATLPPAEHDRLTRELAADAALAAEFEHVSHVVAAVRELREVALPAGWRAQLDRRLQATAAQRPTAGRGLRLTPAWAGAALLLLLGFAGVRVAQRPAPSESAPAPAPTVVAAAPHAAPAPVAPVAPVAPPAAAPAPVAPAASEFRPPVRVARVVPVAHEPRRRAVVRQTLRADNTAPELHRLDAKVVGDSAFRNALRTAWAPEPGLAPPTHKLARRGRVPSTVRLAGAIQSGAASALAEIPEPDELNAIDRQPVRISFASTGGASVGAGPRLEFPPPPPPPLAP